MDESIWKLADPGPAADLLAVQLGIPLPIARILANRKIADPETARRFLHGTLDDLHDPYLMAGMEAAADRVFAAIEAGQPILIFGDYDADGILAMVMLHKALTTLGARVEHFIPERLRDGYGLKDEHIAVAAERGARLVISVDCGIKAEGFVRKARELGIDVIITDHHLPGAALPEALAVLDPVLESSGYPDRSLAGVGVAYKLIQALFVRAGKTGQLRHYLKLVAIGTISDIAALRGENRILVRQGLRELDEVANVGLRGLIEVSGLSGKRISEGDVGFRIGPRINAAGRMGSTELAVRLFFTESAVEALDIARQLDRLNGKRQKEEDRIYTQALARIRDRGWERYRILILGCEEWSRGIVGIVASRLKEAFSRPVILFAYDDGKAHGSGRSISEFSLIDCLEECREHFLSYGGHKYAIGCTLARDSMPAFRLAATRVAEERITDEHLRRKVRIDTPLEFTDLTPAFLDLLDLLGPFGVENPRPVFLTEGAEVVGRPRKLKDSHIKFLVRHRGRLMDAIGWQKGEWFTKIALGDRFDLAYTLQSSSYLGEESLYLSLEAMRRSA
jgi:single-stranded-DNA-specific exonuclease